MILVSPWRDSEARDKAEEVNRGLITKGPAYHAKEFGQDSNMQSGLWCEHSVTNSFPR